MLNLSVKYAIKTLSNTTNIYDGMIFGLNYIPTKPVAVATAAIASGVALYLTQPETLLTQVGVVAISSALGYAATEVAHQVGSTLWKKRLAALDTAHDEYEKTPQALEETRRDKEAIGNVLDKLFADPEFLK